MRGFTSGTQLAYTLGMTTTKAVVNLMADNKTYRLDVDGLPRYWTSKKAEALHLARAINAGFNPVLSEGQDGA